MNLTVVHGSLGVAFPITLTPMLSVLAVFYCLVYHTAPAMPSMLGRTVHPRLYQENNLGLDIIIR